MFGVWKRCRHHYRPFSVLLSPSWISSGVGRVRAGIQNIAASPVKQPSSSSSHNNTRDGTTNASNKNEALLDRRVVIVGGGPTGLFMAHLLRSYYGNNVPFTLIDAQTPDERFQHPQAHFLNTRSMEVLKHGLRKDVYNQITSAMPPVDEWKSFYFGPTMMTTGCLNEVGAATTTMMAQVVHPVDRPLTANADANGRRLVQPPLLAVVGSHHRAKDDDDLGKPFLDKASASAPGVGVVPLSELSVGHLAQHRFCKILYESLLIKQKQEGPDNNNSSHNILYGTRVTECTWNEDERGGGQWHVQTDKGDDIQASIVVAADGARSFVRSKILNIPMNGQPNIQHLINVHFQVSKSTEAQIPPAMLYTIFHPHVLAMVVRHGKGDYVMQIPYFHPYQTLDDDFTHAKVEGMVHAALGGGGANVEFTIRSIRPWTMGSLVAESYFNEKGVFLVGDAAHVFPPAGGFGMNTGLQDVYSLAWRVFLLFQRGQTTAPYYSSPLDESRRRRTNDVDDDARKRSAGYLYQQERQPVARQNAALSVRNYQRVLGVMEACYLNHKHPKALIAALDATSAFVPFKIRQQTFRTLLQTALLPFHQLLTSPTGMYAKHVTQKLRTVLESGQGLPLLFPKHELAFSYQTQQQSIADDRIDEIHSTADWTRDSWSSSPRLAVGSLFPHMVVHIPSETARFFPSLHPMTSCMNDDDEDDTTTTTSIETQQMIKISTTDLAAQFATPEMPVLFCLLEVRWAAGIGTTVQTSSEIHSEIDLVSMREKLQDSLHVPFLAAKLLVTPNVAATATGRSSMERSDDGVIRMFIDLAEWEQLNLLGESHLAKEGFCLVAIRPDGHVASIVSDSTQLERLIDETRAIL